MQSTTQNKELTIPESQELEIAASPEQLAASPRLVIYGSTMGGSFDLCDIVNEQLEARGITGIDVYVSRDIANIQNAFYGRNRNRTSTLPSGTLALPETPTEEKGGLLQRIGNKLLSHSEAGVMPIAELPQEKSTLASDTIPAGVMVFPEMRQYTGHEHSGTTIDTPYERIEELCRQHGVPIVYVEKNVDTAEELGRHVNELFSSHKELPPAIT